MRALLTVALLAAASPALAEPANELSIGGSSRSLRSSSANAVTDDNLGGGELTYARYLPIEVVPELQIWGTASYAWGGVEGAMFQTLTTEVDSHGLTAGGRARFRLHRLAYLTGRMDLGMTHTSLEITDAMGRSLSDGKWHAETRGAVGLDLYAVAMPRFSLGVRFELGYVAATGATLAPREDDPSDDTIMLEESQASIGTLDLAGRYFTLGAVMAF